MKLLFLDFDGVLNTHDGIEGDTARIVQDILEGRFRSIQDALSEDLE